MARKPSPAALRKRIEANRARLAEDEAELKRLEEEASLGILGDVDKAFATLGALKEALLYLRKNFKKSLSEDLQGFNFATFPRENKLALDAGFSESEGQLKIEKGRKAVEGL